MRQNFRATVWRLAAFVAVCLLGAFALVMVFAQLRFEGGEKTYDAVFSSVSGLAGGNFVRIAGVEVGKVKHISINDDGKAVVEFAIDDTVQLTDGSKAYVRWDNPIGARYMELEDGPGVGRVLPAGATIPLDRTRPAMDLDALIGGFRPLFRALSPDQVNTLSSELIQAFQGQGDTINSLLAQTAAFTNTLADRDTLIGEVIGNLNTVLGSLGGQSDQLAKTVDSLSTLMSGLAARKTDIVKSIAYSNFAASTVADLLQQTRPAIHNTVAQTDRVAGIALADHDYLDDVLKTLPDTYQKLSRQGLYGDFFSFYMCDLVLKMNGKGGQPVYIKVAGQSTGRCAPK
ncbi:MAG TPA: MCE family protein [Mycobacterium sp.]|jgi:phospholipid/cholesterol/gamma-HCH transport system substrate-binding protein|nr:MCE family protein [Mycobacterium sp.]